MVPEDLPLTGQWPAAPHLSLFRNPKMKSPGNPKLEPDRPPSNGTDEDHTWHLLRRASEPGADLAEPAGLHSATGDTARKAARILVAEDTAEMRVLMVLALRALGYQNIAEAVDGQAALEMLQDQEFDLLILDIEMPRMDGFTVLEAHRKLPEQRRPPVVVTSGLGDLEAVVRCIELGADDFLQKPVNQVILRARMESLLERKHLRDLERRRLLELQREKQRLEREQEKSERLLLNRGEQVIAERHECVTVLFADLVQFTTLANRSDPSELVALLNELFSRFDRLTDQLGLEKIKTIGDGYLVAGGLPVPRPDHAEAVAAMGLAMLAATEEVNRDCGTSLRLRIGMNSGPAIAGVIGRKKFTYDLWGPAVNLASRMESSGLPGHIHMPASLGELLAGKYAITERGVVHCKGIGEVRSCLLAGAQSSGESADENNLDRGG
jgi:adenylate cyclase